ncbi:hypothetical protein BH10PSE7_BH10PSE7_24830 [soil metagenome]
MSRAQAYRICTGIILLGFVMLIQPVSMFVFSWGLPVLLAGVIMHAILDHMSEWRAEVPEGMQVRKLV